LRHIGLSRALGTGLAFGLLMASSRPALGQMALDWQAPEGCNERPLLEARVQELTGSSLEQQDLIGELHVVVMQVPSGWRLGMRMERDGQLLSRELEGEDCISLTHAAASAIALLLEPTSEPPEGAEAPPTPDPTEEEKPAAHDPSRGETSTPATTPSAAGPGWRLGGRFATGVDFNLFPRAAGIVSLALFAERGNFRVELGSQAVPEQNFDVGSGVTLSHLPLAARACQGASWGAVWLLPCAHFEVGYIRARGATATSDTAATATSWAAGLTVLAGYRLAADVGVVLEAPILLPLARHRLQVEGLGILHELPVVDARLAGGLEVRW